MDKKITVNEFTASSFTFHIITILSSSGKYHIEPAPFYTKAIYIIVC